MRVVYKPTGAAAEYARLALNPYKGCVHRCVYCYNNRRFRRGVFFESADPRLDVLDKLPRDLEDLVAQYSDVGRPEIQLTFLGDAYQPAEAELKLTRRIIKLFIEFNQPFTILTKSPLIQRDFDLLSSCKLFRLGMSFTTMDPIMARRWEPGTYNPRDRLDVLKKFHAAGGKTWISLEPIMYLNSTIECVEKLKNTVDHIWIGALRHFETQAYDIMAGKEKLRRSLEDGSADYSFKKSMG